MAVFKYWKQLYELYWQQGINELYICLKFI